MVGAVVGVQPFGGEGLSGTGPKAGGPLYLSRLLSACSTEVLSQIFPDASQAVAPALLALEGWTRARKGGEALARACEQFRRGARTGQALLLPGPTGERNVYSIAPRERVLCLAESDADRLTQLAANLASRCQAVWPRTAQPLLDALPAEVQSQVSVARDWTAPEVRFDAVLLHGSQEELAAVQRVLSERPGPIVNVERLDPSATDLPLERLVVERALSINTAAAGGNASLMTLN
jgi:RHH-type proline utilization regulon transcriptional repressor/proline dehydrogenase/delta 1-pyrroline-5-carboxylate dehydrogenase